MHCLRLCNQKYLQGQDCTCHPQKPFSPIFWQYSIHEADLGAANCDHVAVKKKEKIAVWVIWEVSRFFAWLLGWYIIALWIIRLVRWLVRPASLRPLLYLLPYLLWRTK